MPPPICLLSVLCTCTCSERSSINSLYKHATLMLMNSCTAMIVEARVWFVGYCKPLFKAVRLQDVCSIKMISLEYQSEHAENSNATQLFGVGDLNVFDPAIMRVHRVTGQGQHLHVPLLELWHQVDHCAQLRGADRRVVRRVGEQNAPAAMQTDRQIERQTKCKCKTQESTMVSAIICSSCKMETQLATWFRDTRGS